MKHFFIINPVAGHGKGVEIIKEQVAHLEQTLQQEHEFHYYITKKQHEATELVEQICQTYTKERIRIFACGGDGTCFEVVNGLKGKSNVEMGIIPVGSCNDFLKSFPDIPFLDLAAQIQGQAIPVDFIRVNDEFALNVANFGFDAKVNHDQIRYRHRFKTVKRAYNYALMKNIFSPQLGDTLTVTVDHQLLFQGKALLMTVANAMYYGGGYKCAPLSDYQDGLLDVMVVKKISLFTFIRLVKYYKKGEHLNHPRFAKFIAYQKGKHIEIDSKSDVVGCLDGETRIGKHFELEVVAKGLNFILPQNK